MLAAWMLYTLAVTLLCALAAAALERTLLLIDRPSRWSWPGALLLAAVLSAGALVGGTATVDPVGTAGSPAPVEEGPAISPIPASVRVPSGGILERASAPLAVAWAGAVALLLGWVGFGRLRLRRRERGWKGTTIGSEELLVSDDVGPALVGVFGGRLVLPHWCLSLPEEAVELVIAHETEHRRAGDTKLLAVVGLAALLFPWNLPLWGIFHRTREAVEVDCDRRVLRRFPDRRKLYGALLLEVCGRRVAGSGALATFSEHRSTLARRIRMLSQIVERTSPRRVAALTVAGGLAVVVACLVPGPDRDDASIVEPEDAAGVPAAAGISDEPTFTPYEVMPELRNPREVQAALVREYPPVLRDAGIGGIVEVWLFIDEEGEVRNARVARSSGHEALDAAAERVGYTFRFSPALNREHPVPVWISVPVRFTTGEDAPGQGVPVRGAGDADAVAEASPGSDPAPPPPPAGGRIPDDAPTFTPYEVEPEIRNPDEVQEALAREYPPTLRDAGIGGVAELHVFIDADGTVGNVAVAESSGFAPLDEAALRVARELRFTPARNRDEAVPVWVRIPIRFTTGDG